MLLLDFNIYLKNIFEQLLLMFDRVYNTPLGSDRLGTVLSENSLLSDAVVRRCPIKKMFSKISQNSQENAYTSVSFLIKLQTFPADFAKF